MADEETGPEWATVERKSIVYTTSVTVGTGTGLTAGIGVGARVALGAGVAVGAAVSVAGRVGEDNRVGNDLFSSEQAAERLITTDNSPTERWRPGTFNGWLPSWLNRMRKAVT